MFQNIDMASKALDGLMYRYNATANNIANVETEGYKRQDYNFEEVLKSKIQSGKEVTSTDIINSYHEDLTTYSYNENGNNVDINSEMTAQAQTQLRYNALITRTSAQLAQYSTLLQSLK